MTFLLATYLLAVCLFLAVSGADIQQEKRESQSDSIKPATCLHLLQIGCILSGVYKVYPYGTDMYSIDVYCDQQTDGGGWTVFQRRMNGWVEFYRNWYSYKLGFGDVNGEHWLGNDNLVVLLGRGRNELRVDLEAGNNEKAFAKYSKFSVGDESTNYTLQVSGYSGTAGESMAVHSDGSRFSTFDRDNDKKDGASCAEMFHGAWWYGSCHSSNLNSGNYYTWYHKSYADGLNWLSFKGLHESLKTTEMKFRAV